ncbi:MAG TPA: gamma-glutamylcyclotransferase family protein [Thermoanaerobaculia bacterium]|nr:gamma-glutamylcyclotransferase family protein [Thermoanaerobaculia bacterium]
MNEFSSDHSTTATRLVIYGSLAPGERHHDVLAPLRGEWRRCRVRGILREHAGYRILEWRGDAPWVEALLFLSPELPRYWDELDAFEGEDYQRIVVPVETEEGETIANLYADRKRLTGSEMRS